MVPQNPKAAGVLEGKGNRWFGQASYLNHPGGFSAKFRVATRERSHLLGWLLPIWVGGLSLQLAQKWAPAAFVPWCGQGPGWHPFCRGQQVTCKASASVPSEVQICRDEEGRECETETRFPLSLLLPKASSASSSCRAHTHTHTSSGRISGSSSQPPWGRARAPLEFRG